MEAERLAAEAARIEALKPDVQKLADWILRVEHATDDMPVIEDGDAKHAMDICHRSIVQQLGLLEKWIDEEAR